MKMYRFWLLQLLSSFTLIIAPVSVAFVLAQPDQSGFISIDCGLSEISNYIHPETRIFYTSDEGFIDSGVNIAIDSTVQNPGDPSLRSFPEGVRNCYTLRPAKGKDNKYLIRAMFRYYNYDGKNQVPEFDMYIGEDLWTTVTISNAVAGYEIIHIPTTDYIHVCLVRTGKTIPFISALELRPLNNTSYTTRPGSLETMARWNLGSDERFRYPDDVYDRMWIPLNPIGFPFLHWPNTTSLRTNHPLSSSEFSLPSSVMSTAATPQNSNGSLYLSLPSPVPDKWPRFYICLHFAELEELEGHDFRQSQAYMNGEPWFGKFSPRYLQPDSICGTNAERVQTICELSINSTLNSTLPPIINAIEIYRVISLDTPGTYDSDVTAMFGLKSYYGLKRNWQGDPCGSQDFRWDGVTCNDDYIPRIVSLNLSSTGLNGSITPHIADLTSIRILDLSNNNLSGNVPGFLTRLANLTVLNLTGNNFSGSIPRELQEKSNMGLLSFSTDGLSNKEKNSDTRKTMNKVILPIVASTLAIFLLVVSVLITISAIRRRRETVIGKKDVNLNKNNATLESKDLVVPYSEILKMTNNLERVLGKGGFGRVYHGFMGDVEVAVKMLDPSSTQGRKEFQTEEITLASFTSTWQMET